MKRSDVFEIRKREFILAVCLALMTAAATVAFYRAEQNSLSAKQWKANYLQILTNATFMSR